MPPAAYRLSTKNGCEVEAEDDDILFKEFGIPSNMLVVQRMEQIELEQPQTRNCQPYRLLESQNSVVLLLKIIEYDSISEKCVNNIWSLLMRLSVP